MVAGPPFFILSNTKFDVHNLPNYILIMCEMLNEYLYPRVQNHCSHTTQTDGVQPYILHGFTSRGVKVLRNYSVLSTITW